jgi:hypothetical protein
MATKALLATLLGLLFAGDPTLEWSTLETRHLDIHHHQGMEDMAARTAAQGERIIAQLSRLFRRPLDQRVQVVIVDSSDAANGYANTLPYNHLVLYPYPPGSRSDLANYRDWLTVLLTHELTHVMQIEHAPGLWRVLNAALGRTFQPAHLHPSWMLEGLAVVMESTLSGRGRLDYGPFGAALRAQVEADALLSLDQIIGPRPMPPGGQIAYLYGASFFRWVLQEYGLARLLAYFESYDWWLVPYFSDTHARRAFGEEWGALHAAWLADLKWALAPVMARTPSGARVAVEGEYHAFPVPTPAGLFFTQGGGDGPGQVRRLRDDATGSEAIYTCYGGCVGLTWDATRRRLVVARAEFSRLIYAFTDLYAVDPASGEETRLTRGARLHDPSYCAALDRVIAARTRLGQTELVAVHPTDGAITALASLPGQAPISDPVCGPEGHVVYLSSPLDDQWDVWRLRLEDGRLDKVTDDVRVERDLRRVDDRGRLTVSVADDAGVPRVRLIDPAGRRTAWLSQSRTADLFGAWEGGDAPLWLTRVHAGGRALVRQAAPAEIQWRPMAQRRRDRVAAARVMAPPDLPDPPETRPYRPLKSLRPYAWRPTWVIQGTRLATLGLSVDGSDAVGHHGWTLAGDSPLTRWNPAASASYRYSALWPTLSLSGYTLKTGDMASYNDALHPWPRWLVGGALGASLSVPGAADRWGFNARYGYSYYARLHSRRDVLYDPDSIEPYFPDAARVAELYGAVSYDSRHGYGYSVAPEEGFMARLSSAWRDPWLGGDARRALLRLRLEKPVALRWPRRAVLTFTWRSALSWSEDGANVYALGGAVFPSVTQQLINQEFLGDVDLAGYAPGAQVGRHAQRATVELHAPIWRVYRGVHPVPIFARTLSMRLFSASGVASEGIVPRRAPLVSVGGEARLGLTFWYGMPFKLVAGYAHGLSEGGVGQMYIYLGL